jgi:polyisoprenoid-binding protein YceI
MRTLLLSLCLALALPFPAAQAQAPRKVDRAKSSIRFVTQQMNVPVEGQFTRFDATVAFDPAKPEATKAEFEVDLGSIDLGNAEGETEAKRKAWLDVEGFPKARFVAESVKQTAPGKYIATGPLTIKGASQPVAAPFTLNDSGNARIVEGQFTLKRLAFRIGEGPWSDTDTVADEVLVRFRFTLPK